MADIKTIRAICKEGICPLCGGKVSYTYKGKFHEEGVRRWKCPNCAAYGQEGVKTVFDGHHYHVHDSEGNPCKIQFPSLMADHQDLLEGLVSQLDQNQRAKAAAQIRAILKGDCA